MSAHEEAATGGKECTNPCQNHCGHDGPFIGNIKSIATDNGSEFACHRLIAQRLKTKVCFALPYASWEKGNIENTNKPITQYVPKGADFEQYNDQRIKQIQMEINARPRKKLKFSTPKQEFYNSLIQICTCYWNPPFREGAEIFCELFCASVDSHYLCNRFFENNPDIGRERQRLIFYFTNFKVLPCT